MICSFPYQRRNKMGRWESFPCGRCAACKIAKAQEWTGRMVHESDSWSHSAFLTLTEDDDNVISLDKRKLQKAFKRARRSGLKFRYYACGEYGGSTFRPHYHVCIFYEGDLGFEPDSSLGRSNGRLSWWPFGLANLGVFSAQSARYTADYLLKSIGVEYPLFLEAPFRLVSTGFGKLWISTNLEQVEAHGVTVGGTHVPVSRYYKKLFSEAGKQRLIIEARNRPDTWTLSRGIQADKNIRARQALYRTED